MLKLKVFFVLFAVFNIVSCAQDGTLGPVGPQGAPASSISSPNPTSDIQTLVNQENAYRAGLGQTALSAGLTCTLYKVTGGQFIQNDATHTPTLTGITSAASFSYIGTFNQPNVSTSVGLNILPAALQSNPAYQNLILLRCQGQIVITDTGYYSFALSSDDGSVLYIDGSRLIDNDGNHGVQTVIGQKYLRRGVHPFRLDFGQTGGGNQALILNANGALVPSNVFYY